MVKKLIMGIIYQRRVTVATAAVWDTALSLSERDWTMTSGWILAPRDDYCRIADGPRQTPAKSSKM
jgi:hypothetical protein